MSEPKSNIDYCHMINEQAKKLTALRDENAKLKDSNFMLANDVANYQTNYELYKKENAKLKAVLREAYIDIKEIRESGDAGNWSETELEKRIKSILKDSNGE